MCGLREENLRDLSIRTKVSQVPECVSELEIGVIVFIQLLWDCHGLVGAAMEISWGTGNTAHWNSLKDYLGWVGLSGQRKHKRNLHWRYFHSQNSVA